MKKLVKKISGLGILAVLTLTPLACDRSTDNGTNNGSTVDGKFSGKLSDTDDGVTLTITNATERSDAQAKYIDIDYKVEDKSVARVGQTKPIGTIKFEIETTDGNEYRSPVKIIVPTDYSGSSFTGKSTITITPKSKVLRYNSLEADIDISNR